MTRESWRALERELDRPGEVWRGSSFVFVLPLWNLVKEFRKQSPLRARDGGGGGGGGRTEEGGVAVSNY